MRWAAVPVAAALAISNPTAVAAASPKPLFTLADSRLDELSGLAVSHRSPGLLFAQNDSGDSARFFALDRRTGAVRSECVVPDAQNVDWEDLATGPDAQGAASVWLADIGDNDAQRSEVRLYRVDEPTIGPAARTVTGRPDEWRLRYPDGPRDAESLLLDPLDHRPYIVTKSLLGRSEVFQVPAAPDPHRIQLLRRVGTVNFRFTGTPGGPNVVGELTATGGAISADGSLLAIRTYTDAYLFRVRGTDVAGALRADPVVLPLPAQPQGEGIAIDGNRLLIDSERVGSPVFAVALPAAIASPAGSTAAGSASAPAGGSTPRRATSDRQSSRPAASASHSGSSQLPSGGGLALLVGLAGVAVAGVLATAGLRRRRRH